MSKSFELFVHSIVTVLTTIKEVFYRSYTDIPHQRSRGKLAIPGSNTSSILAVPLGNDFTNHIHISFKFKHLITLSLMLSSMVVLHSQYSPSGQILIEAPAVFSACSDNDLCITLSNNKEIKGQLISGPMKLEIIIPGGSLVKYISTISDLAAQGVTQTNYDLATNKLNVEFPIPALGQSKKFCITLRPDCNIGIINPLPEFLINAMYPSGYPISMESVTSALGNIGAGVITATGFTNRSNTTWPFAGSNRDVVKYTNTGYGVIRELTVKTTVPKIFAFVETGPGLIEFSNWDTTNAVRVPSSPSSNGTLVSTVINPDSSVTYTHTLSGANFGPDGELGVNESFTWTYLGKVPRKCVQGTIKYEFSYNCGNNLPACNPPVEFFSTRTINDPLPTIAGTYVGANQPEKVGDGCATAKKFVKYVWKNNGSTNALVYPSVTGVAYDVSIYYNFNGPVDITDLVIGGKSISAFDLALTQGGSLNSVSGWRYDFKDKNTDPTLGLSDIDGDGFYDDLPAMGMIPVEFKHTSDISEDCSNYAWYYYGRLDYTDICEAEKTAWMGPFSYFGLERVTPVTQTSVNNYGQVNLNGPGDQTAKYTFNYRTVGSFTIPATATAQLKIRQSMSMETYRGSVKLNGTTLTLASTEGAGGDNSSATTGLDSVLIYDIPSSMIASLYDGTQDNIEYMVRAYNCDVRQTTKQADNWSLCLKFNPGPCPDGSAPAEFDLGCKKAYVYQINRGCGVKPCIVVASSLFRESELGFTNVSETTPIAGIDSMRMYECDTFQVRMESFINGDWPVVEPNGFYSSQGYPMGDAQHYFSMTFPATPKMVNTNQSPFEFLSGISEVCVYPTIKNAMGKPIGLNKSGAPIATAPVIYQDFATINGQNTQAQAQNLPISATTSENYKLCELTYPLAWNINDMCSTTGIQGYNNGKPSDMNRRMYFSEDKDKATLEYYLNFGQALWRGGYTGNIFGDDDFGFEVKLRYKVRSDIELNDEGDFQVRGGARHLGDGYTYSSTDISNTKNPDYFTNSNMGSCGEFASSANYQKKDIFVENPQALYSSDCGTDVSNKLRFESFGGQGSSGQGYFRNGEVRVPYKIKDIKIAVPVGYEIDNTSPITFKYNQGCTELSTTMLTLSGTTGMVTVTHTGDMFFPRMDDCAGKTTAYNLCYKIKDITNGSTPTTLPLYTTFTLVDEADSTIILRDTATVSNQTPMLSLASITPILKNSDGGDCQPGEFKFLIKNTGSVIAKNAYFAVDSSATSKVVGLEGQKIDSVVNYTSGKFAYLKDLMPGDSVCIIVKSQVLGCSGNFKAFLDWNCTPITMAKPDKTSTHIDSTDSQFDALEPYILSRPITGTFAIKELCTDTSLIIEVRNANFVNLDKLVGNIILPPSLEVIPGSLMTSYPTQNTFVSGGSMTVVNDTVKLDLNSVNPFNTPCGMTGSDTLTRNNIRIKIGVRFVACPGSTAEDIMYNFTGENYCGKKTDTRGIMRMFYIGQGGNTNTFSMLGANLPARLCAKKNETQSFMDTLFIKNLGGGDAPGTTTAGTDSVTVSFPFNTTTVDLTNFKLTGPYLGTPVGLDAQGNPLFKIAVPAGIPVGGTSPIPIMFDVTPKVDSLCLKSDIPPFCSFAQFTARIPLVCPAKNLDCSAVMPALTKGASLNIKEFECCYMELGSTIFKDLDNDGMKDPTTDTGIDGVKVYLYASNAAGNPVGAPIDSTVTMGGGLYKFDSLFAGDYIVGVQPPVGSIKSSPADATDTNPNLQNGTTVTPAGIILSNKISLVTDMEPVGAAEAGTNDAAGDNQDNLDDKNGNMTIDFGLVPTVSLGSNVFADANNDGLKGATDPGVAGATVKLYADTNGDGVPDGAAIATAITDAMGNYLFDSLIPGNYIVGVMPPDSLKKSSTPTGGEFDDSVDDNDNGKQASEGAEIFSSTINLVPGQETTNEPGSGGAQDNAVDANGDMTIDFGLVPAFDMALTKVSIDAGYKYPGDTASYKITVFNQSSVAVDSIEVSDYIPSGLQFSSALNPTWDSISATLVKRVIKGPIPAGGMLMDTIKLKVLTATSQPRDYTNVAEISKFEDANNNDVSTFDSDSDINSDPADNGGGRLNTPSDNATGGDGTGAEGTMVATTDEDNSDPAIFPIFDLALTKSIDATSFPTDGMFDAGDIVIFNTTVYNQGNVTAYSINLIDSLPCGLKFNVLNSPGWSDPGSTGLSTYTQIDSILPGQNRIVKIAMQVKTSAELLSTCSGVPAKELFKNYAEVKSAEDKDGNMPLDIDSSPNTKTPEETGVIPNLAGDNDLMSTSNTGVGSQDDSDVANLEIFDLALSKKIKNPAAIPYKSVDPVTFEICITNQGNIPTDSIVITDYVPFGYNYLASNDANGWVYNAGTRKASKILKESDFTLMTLDFGEVKCTDITLTVLGGADDYVNIAEISGATSLVDTGAGPGVRRIVFADNDSNFDTLSTNDAGGKIFSNSDDAILGDGSGMPGDTDPLIDEDNADVAAVPVVDFALVKKVVSAKPFSVGDTIEFSIDVINQGNVAGQNIQINDYVPANLEFRPGLNPLWTPTFTGTSSTYMKTLPGILMPGDTATETIKLVVLAGSTNAADYTNMAEINQVFAAQAPNTPVLPGGLITPGANITSYDIDSRADADATNDPGSDATSAENGADDAVLGTGKGAIDDGIAATDEDDADPALVQIVDLALTKTIVTPKPYEYGDTIEYKVTVFNQGNGAATNVGIVDQIPAGFTYDPTLNTSWNKVGNQAFDTIAGPIPAGGMAMSTIKLVLNRGFKPEEYKNVAEITSSQDANGNDTSESDQDSNADTNSTNDAGGSPNSPSDNATAGTGTNGNGTAGDGVAATDEDDADPALLDLVDMALNKKLTTTGKVKYGDTVSFEIKVFNQGTVDARSIMVSDYIPAGMMFVTQPNWTATGSTAKTTISSLNAGDSTTVSIKLKLQMVSPSTDSTWTNISEISMFTDKNGMDITTQDADSDGDTNPSNDAGGDPNSATDDTVKNENGDEDDQDPALVEVFDIASTKSVVTTGTIKYGTSIEFKVTTINQGNQALENVQVTDYIPAGLEFDTDANTGWMWGGGATATYTIPGRIEPGQMVMKSIFLKLKMVNPATATSFTNVAEVSSMTDTLGTPITRDIDSDINNNPADNGGGLPGSGSDGATAGNGSGMPGDASSTTDEDNSDPAIVPVFDLATVIGASTDTITMYNQPVTFPVSLVNQGSIAADKPEVTVIIPSGFSFNSAVNMGWTDNMDGTATYIYPDTLNSGDSVGFNLILTSKPALGKDAWTVYAEISKDNPVVAGAKDIDSTPDLGSANDAGGRPNPDSENGVFPGTDDILFGDGTAAPTDLSSTAATDEDDHDPEFINIVDVASRKVAEPTGPIKYGSVVPFIITVQNQGNVALSTTEITDYIAPGFMFDENLNPGWTLTGTVATKSAGPLLPGESTMDTIMLTVIQTDGGVDNYTNVAEVSKIFDEDNNDISALDVDSALNSDPTDNGGGEPNSPSDNVLTGDGTGMPGDTTSTTDEDNSDPALIQVFDLAISMEDTPTNNTVTMYGQDVTFPITLENQGNVAAAKPVLTVQVPAGFTLSAASATAGWSYNPATMLASLTYPDTLKPGDSVTISSLVLTSKALPAGTPLSAYAGAWTPEIEISKDNPVVAGMMDIDSDPDSIYTNDLGGNPSPDTNDQPTVGSDDALDGVGNGGEGAVGAVNGIDPVTDEDDNDPEYVRLTDLALKKVVTTASPYKYNQLLDFEMTVYNQGNVPMDSIVISDYLPVGFGYTAANNAGWTGVDGAGMQTLTYGDSRLLLPGDSAKVILKLTLLQTDGGVANYTNNSEISFMQDTIGNNTTGAGPNGGLTDVDSPIDNTPGNDQGGVPNTASDNAIDGNGTGMPNDSTAVGDEDNSDPALIQVFDLAVAMEDTPTNNTVTAYGQDVTFPITLENQGNVAAAKPVLTVQVPAGFTLSAASATAGWSYNSATMLASLTYPDTLKPGDSVTINSLVLTSKALPAGTPLSAYAGAWTPEIEISKDNPVVAGMMDIDSDPDSIYTNDLGGNPSPDTNDQPTVGSDDALDGVGNGGEGAVGAVNGIDPVTDEDDNDPEYVRVFDLALKKQTMQMSGTRFGDSILFMVTVYNQGNIPARNFNIVDYVPSGFAYVASVNDTSGWANTSATLSTFTSKAGYVLLPGDSLKINYTLRIMMSNMGNAFANHAEISYAEDTKGNNTTGAGPNGGLIDADSTPDTVNDNDDGSDATSSTNGANDVINGNGKTTGNPDDGIAGSDEDDADPSIIEVTDIAMIKTVNNPKLSYKYGDTVSYNIALINQGNVDLFNTKVSDYVPNGLTFDASINPGWTLTGTTASTVYTDTLMMWDSVNLTIKLLVKKLIPATQVSDSSYTNLAEVSQILDKNGVDISANDIDSKIDSIRGNDSGNNTETAEDDFVNGDSDKGEDEDDSDPALIKVYDLALTKQLVYPDSIYLFGQTIEFIITVHNQGNDTMKEVKVTEYVPGSLTDVGVTNMGWSFASGLGTYNLAGPIAPGEIDTVKLSMKFQAGATYEDYINYAEISDFQNEDGDSALAGDIVDADSKPDSTKDNDGGGVPSQPGNPSPNDDYVDGNGTGNFGDTDAAGDEDDHDPVLLGFVDMALTKTSATTTPVKVGNKVTFDIKVFNQGTFDIKNIQVVDYIPSGFSFIAADNPLWSLINPITATRIIADTLGFNEDTTIQIVLTVKNTASRDSLVNKAELGSFMFGFGNTDISNLDIDSDADTLSGNDAGGNIYTSSDNAVDGDGTGTSGDDIAETDEDDEDPAAPPVVDLALKKTTMQTLPVIPGDEVTFQIEVFNQGNVPVTNVEIADLIPTGYVLSTITPNGWTATGQSAKKVITDTILRDSSVVVEITLTVTDSAFKSKHINIAEITAIEDTTGTDVTLFDLDSQAGNETGGAANNIGTPNDDNIDTNANLGQDEDDSDPAPIPVLDLAIQKKLAVDIPAKIGDVVKFTIQVINQGTIIADSIVVSDFIPAGLELATVPGNAIWTLTGAIASTVINNELAVGEDTTLCIWLKVKTNAVPKNVVNMAEITAVRDTLGNLISDRDIDSKADGVNDDKGNDIYSDENDKLNESGTNGGDEDDHDQAWVNLCGSIICNGPINYSLDENCEIAATPSVFLSGDLYPDHLYTVTITDANGNIHSNKFTRSDLGKTFMVTVGLPLCGNNICWTSMKVEDKLLPTITCANDTISCVMPVESSALPTFTKDNCSDAQLVLLSQNLVTTSCDPVFIAKAVRTWTVKDSSGNQGNICRDTICLERTKLDSIVYPGSYTLGNALTCKNFATDANGNPNPSVTGVPRLRGVALFPFTQTMICNGNVRYFDEVQLNTDCKKMIMRTWEIVEWWCESTIIRNHVQMIEIKDNVPPVITRLPDMTANTSGASCEGLVNLPQAKATDNCNPTGISYKVFLPSGILETNGGAVRLPVGTHMIRYAASDICSNQSYDTIFVTVVDRAEPIAICKSNIVVSLNEQGTAMISKNDIDAGSFDECSPVTVHIRRVTPGCDTSVQWGEKVNLCCDDAGKSTMIALRATDAGGRINQCMVAIEVQDKRLPVMVCPATNVEITCTTSYNLANLGATFGPASISGGGCLAGGSIKDTLIADNLNQCRIGNLTRRIQLFKNNALISTCLQTITLKAAAPFNKNMIAYPKDTTIANNACTRLDLDPKKLKNGQPVIVGEGVCDQIGFSHEDEYFEFAGNSACFKILRHWTVINACQRDANNRLWQDSFTQIILVTNTIAPTITSDTTQKVLCSLDASCNPERITLKAAATDDCTPQAELQWSYTIKLQNGSTLTGTGNDASGVYPFGAHRVSFSVFDKCGNAATTSYSFVVKSCKAPTARCMVGLSTNLVGMDTNGVPGIDAAMSILKPSYFDNASSASCGNTIKLSFSANVNDTTLILDCRSRGTRTVQLWVSDNNGNQTYCQTTVLVTDLALVCPTIGMLTNLVNGNVKTIDHRPMNQVQVTLAELTDDKAVYTDQEGKYNFGNLESNKSYVVTPKKIGDDGNGITTLDLVLIQRHVLGLTKINDPYLLLAADVNRDGKISTTDLVILRKLILGNSDNLPEDKSWLFVWADQSFINPLTDELMSEYVIDSLKENMSINFIAIKIGDINQSATVNANDIQTDPRSSATTKLFYHDIDIEEGQTYDLPLHTDKVSDVNGLQFALNNDNFEITAINGSTESVKTQNNATKIAFAQNQKISTTQVASITVKAKQSGKLSDLISIEEMKDYNNEIYLEGGQVVNNIELVPMDFSKSEFELYQNQPNPWSTITKVPLMMPTNALIEYRILDNTGRTIHKGSRQVEAGKQYLEFSNEVFSATGNLILEVNCEGKTKSIKMIKVE